MPISVLQETSASAATLPYVSNCTPGSSLTCVVRNAAAGITYTCSDNINGAWTLVETKADNGNNHASASFKFDGNASAGKPTVTVVPSGGSSSVVMFISEIGGTSGFDTNHAADNINKGTGADAITTGNATPSVQPGLIYAVGFRAVGTGALTPGTGFTAGNTADPANITENRRYTSFAAAAGTMTDSVGSDDVIMFGLWFKETGATASSRNGAQELLGVGS